MQFAGNVKSSLLLWYVWLNHGVLTPEILQQGTTLKSQLFAPLFAILPLELNLLVSKQEVRGNSQVPESEIVQACKSVSAL